MYTFLSIVYVLVCLFLIFVVLLQPGRGGGMGSSFGGGSSNTVFGASGAGNFLTRLTTASAALFMILSVVLAYMSSGSDKSLELAGAAAKAKQEAKAKEDAKKGKETVKPAPNLEIESPEGAPIKLEQQDPYELPGAGAPLEAPVPAPVEAKPAPAEQPAAEKVAPGAKPAPVKTAPKAAPAKPAPAKPAEAAQPEVPAPAAETTPAPAAPAPEAPSTP